MARFEIPVWRNRTKAFRRKTVTQKTVSGFSTTIPVVQDVADQTYLIISSAGMGRLYAIFGG